MEKFIPYEKLSKKEKRKLDLAKRQTWGELNPVTRKPENTRAYSRKRTQDWKKELPNPASFIALLSLYRHSLMVCYNKAAYRRACNRNYEAG